MGDACIVNPTVQTTIKKLCAEVEKLGTEGIMFDLTDIYPNSTSERYPSHKDGRQLQNTCFCRCYIDALK